MLNRKLPPLSIRTILLAVSVLFLILPLGSLYFLRIYESALVRQTESELISQAAFISALYKREIITLLEKENVPIASYGVSLPVLSMPVKKEPFQIVEAHLDLAIDPIYPPRPYPKAVNKTLDPIATKAGAVVEPILKDAQYVTLSGIRILDYQGLVAAGHSEHGLSFSEIEEFKKAQKGYPVSILRERRTDKHSPPLSSISRGGKLNVFVAMPITVENRLIGVVWLNRTPTDLMQSFYAKRWDLSATLIVLLVVVILITAITAYTITKPIQALVDQTLKISDGDKTALEPIAHPVTREVAQLSESISVMAKNIQHRNEYISNFAMHVSHEFKTPLTSIQGSIELLYDNWDTMPEKKRQKFLKNIADDTDRLNRLVQRLLELARADVTQSLTSQTTNVLPIIHSVILHYKNKGLEIQFENYFADEAIFARITAESLEAALDNLIENSIQVGATRIELTLFTKPNTIEEFSPIFIRFHDNGPGISEANRVQIFTPFFTTRRAEGGTGLGLSITQSLLQRQQGDIAVADSPSGACFLITLASNSLYA